ncbi:monovalent cation:proton antiporter family protein [Tepidibacter sp. Z1-5]|uniref:monovalent cation:proton antiporter family protein n=1 Tax=Tepidibacter sp. Z1-5 TaxID=3134138 RepID=UPI0030C32ADE
MEHTSISYISLLIIILLATFVPILITKIKFIPIPIVVGEILSGMIIGKSGFNLIQDSPQLEFLYTFGFAFLMFLSGLEIDFNLMKPTSENSESKWYKKPLLVSIILFLITLILSFGIAYLFKIFGLVSNVALMSLILSTTSLGIVVPILKEKNIINSEYGQTILLTALISDFVTMVLITFFVTFYTSKGAYEVLLILLLFVAFFFFYRMGLRFVVNNKIVKELADTTSQIKVRGAFSLILIFISLAQSLGTEIILGTFLAGLIVALLDEKDKSDLYVKLDAIGYGFFVPIFFIMVGANFDIKSVIDNPKAIYLVPALLVAVYAVKIIPSLLLKFNFSMKKSIAAGFLLSSRLSLIIAASAIGLKLGLIKEETNGAIILVAIITCTFSPLVFNQMMPKIDLKNKKNIFIIGINDKSMLLARRLKKFEMNLIFITYNKSQFDKISANGETVYLGDATDVKWLKEVGIKKADTVVVAKSIEDINTEICKICKVEFGIDHIILLTNSQSTPEGESLYGAMSVSPEFATAFMAEHFIIHPKAFSLLFEEEDFMIEEVYLENEEYFFKVLNKLVLPGDCLILSILRGCEKIIPHGNNILKPGDVIMIVGESHNVKKAKNMLGSKKEGSYLL